MLVASANVILRREAPKNLVIGQGIVFRERDSSRPAGAQNDRLNSYIMGRSSVSSSRCRLERASHSLNQFILDHLFRRLLRRPTGPCTILGQGLSAEPVDLLLASLWRLSGEYSHCTDPGNLPRAALARAGCSSRACARTRPSLPEEASAWRLPPLRGSGPSPRLPPWQGRCAGEAGRDRPTPGKPATDLPHPIAAHPAWSDSRPPSRARGRRQGTRPSPPTAHPGQSRPQSPGRHRASAVRAAATWPAAPGTGRRPWP